MSKELQPLMALTPGGNINAYIQAVNAFPVLTQEREQALGEALYFRDDLAAARELVLAHLRFVVHIARSYSGYGLPLADLVQEGNVGLMKAVRRFDPQKGVRLVSFAVHWIKAEMHEYILRNWRIVKIATTKAQRKLFFNLRSAKKSLGWLTNDEAAAMARDLGVASTRSGAWKAGSQRPMSPSMPAATMTTTRRSSHRCTTSRTAASIPRASSRTVTGKRRARSGWSMRWRVSTSAAGISSRAAG